MLPQQTLKKTSPEQQPVESGNPSIKMASIRILPEEVLSNAISFLQRDRASLRALTLVNREFNCSSWRILVRRIDFRVPQMDTSSSTSFGLFMRSLHENEKIALYVQTVTLRWCEGTGTTTANETAYSRANDLLRQLPNVRTLAFEGFGRRPVAFDHSFLEANSLPLLRDLTLIDNTLTDRNTAANHVAKYMISTPVQKIRVFHLNVFVTAPLNRSIVPVSSSRISKLSNLRLGIFHLNTSTLFDILCLPKALEILSCTIPSDEEPSFDDFYNVPVHGALSPAAMTRVLEPVKDTLVELCLGDGIPMIGGSHDGSRTDLSEWKALRRLDIASSCFFPFPHVQGKEREGLWRLLPREIEELDVRRLSRAWSHSPER